MHIIELYVQWDLVEHSDKVWAHHFADGVVVYVAQLQACVVIVAIEEETVDNFVAQAGHRATSEHVCEAVSMANWQNWVRRVLILPLSLELVVIVVGVLIGLPKLSQVGAFAQVQLRRHDVVACIVPTAWV